MEEIKNCSINQNGNEKIVRLNIVEYEYIQSFRSQVQWLSIAVILQGLVIFWMILR